MNIIIDVGVQCMLKDIIMDKPTFLPRQIYKYSMDVTVSPELEPYIEEYAKSVADPEYQPNYNINSSLIRIIKPRVKKSYPEHWREEIDSDGNKVKFAPTDDVILESAIRMEIDDKINDHFDEHKDDVLGELHVSTDLESLKNMAPDTNLENKYLANVFVKNIGWTL